MVLIVAEQLKGLKDQLRDLESQLTEALSGTRRLQSVKLTHLEPFIPNSYFRNVQFKFHFPFCHSDAFLCFMLISATHPLHIINNVAS